MNYIPEHVKSRWNCLCHHDSVLALVSRSSVSQTSDNTQPFSHPVHCIHSIPFYCICKQWTQCTHYCRSTCYWRPKTFPNFSFKLSSILVRLSVVTTQICKIKHNSQKIQSYVSWRSSKVTDLCTNQKLIWNLLLVIYSNFRRTSVFKILTLKGTKLHAFSIPPLRDAPAHG